MTITVSFRTRARGPVDSKGMHSATVARLNWPGRLPPKSLKISIRQRQAWLARRCDLVRESSTLSEPGRADDDNANKEHG
jgi:hypothetical protein